MRKMIVAAFAACCFLLSCSKSSTPNNPVKVATKPPDTVISKTPVDTTTSNGPKAVTKTNSQKVYVHYLPWFETPATSPDGKWGQHWTMANENPDVILPNGRRQIASWFYPMIGPYASSDRDVIDYHLLLMKYAGIDGVIIDWYGIHNVDDYPLNKRNTDSIFKRVPARVCNLASVMKMLPLHRIRPWQILTPLPPPSRILSTCNQPILAAAVI